MRVTFKIRKERFYADSYDINLNGSKIGSISTMARFSQCYGWSVMKIDELGIPWKNTWAQNQPPVSLDEAKKQVKEYIKECLSNPKP
jgi:hypothetical protein